MRIALLLFSLIVFAACGAPDEGPHQGTGVVVEVHHDEGQVVLDHEEIPGVMRAMTMAFSVKDPALLDAAEPGQTVDFEVIYEGGRYYVSAIRAR